MGKYFNSFWHWVGTLGWNEWLLVFAGVCVWGAYCMRGFGSRSKY